MSMKEADLFQVLKDRYIPDLTLSDEPYSRFDCYSLEKGLDIELKCRRKHYEELLIEKDKYEALLARGKKHKTYTFYINSTPKGIYVFDLDKVNPKWETKKLPKTTDFSNTNWVEKEVAFIPITLAKFIAL